jgi:putative transposase
MRYTHYGGAVLYDPNHHQRRSIRLPTWDYREQGAYFVTICTYRRELLFEDAATQALVVQTWNAILRRSKGFRGDEFVVMPNHVHGIVWIIRQPPVGAQHPTKPTHQRAYNVGSRSEPSAVCVGAAPLRPAADHVLRVLPKSLGAIVRTFKTAAARRISVARRTPGEPVWQRNYYERVIRDEQELGRARQYIRDNPAKWAEDKHNPANLPTTGVVRNSGVGGRHDAPLP